MSKRLTEASTKKRPTTPELVKGLQKIVEGSYKIEETVHEVRGEQYRDHDPQTLKLSERLLQYY